MEHIKMENNKNRLIQLIPLDIEKKSAPNSTYIKYATRQSLRTDTKFGRQQPVVINVIKY